MTSRRELLLAGVTLPLVTSLSFDALARGAVNEAPNVPLHKVLYETNSSASIAFARRAARLGAVVQGIQGDVTSLWYDDLYHRWREGAVAVAGLTGPGALFCLEQLAWDHRLQVVLRGRHRRTPDGVWHSFEAPPTVLQSTASALLNAGWAESMADVVMQRPRAAAPLALASVYTPAPPSSFIAEELCSWVIAPRAALEAHR